MAAELSSTKDDSARDAIRAEFERKERQLEHEIDHKPLEVHLSIGVAYNVSARSIPHRPLPAVYSTQTTLKQHKSLALLPCARCSF